MDNEAEIASYHKVEHPSDGLTPRIYVNIISPNFLVSSALGEKIQNRLEACLVDNTRVEKIQVRFDVLTENLKLCLIRIRVNNFPDIKVFDTDANAEQAFQKAMAQVPSAIRGYSKTQNIS